MKLYLAFLALLIVPCVSADDGRSDATSCFPPVAETEANAFDVVDAAMTLQPNSVVVAAGVLGGQAVISWTKWMAECVI